MTFRPKRVGAIFAALAVAGSLVAPLSAQVAYATDEPAAVVQAASSDQVDRVSLEIGATETSRNFNWLSTSDSTSYVQVAVMPEGWQNGDDFPASGELVAYATASMEASELEGWNSCKATVEGLEANTSYVYRVGNDEAWSAAYSFETGDLGDGASFSFMFAGDPQIGASGDAEADTEGWTNTLNTMEAAFPETDFMISLGDQINASAPQTVESEYEGFFAPDALHGITLATNVGNHEVGAKNQHYSYNYNMPNRSNWGAVDATGAASGDYWFTYNGVLFMSLNSNDMNTSEHKAFMKEAIAA
ncbi:hypothetical protein B5F84_09410, partial [Olsenella sp. An290]